MSYKRYGPQTRSGRGWLLGIILAVLVIVLACGGLFYWARSHVPPDRVAPGVRVFAADAEGWTRDQVVDALRTKGYEGRAGQVFTLSLSRGELSVPLEELGLVPDIQAEAEAILAWGHTGNRNRDALNWLLGRIPGADFPGQAELTLREEPLRQLCAQAAEMLEVEPGKTIVYADDEGVEITLGSLGAAVDQAALLSAMKDALAEGSLTVEYVPEIIAPGTPNLNELWESYTTEPVNARFDENYQVQPEKAGRTFDLEEAGEKLSMAVCGVKFRLPAVTLEPELTAEELEGLLFRDLLASVDTPLTADEVRTRNIELAAERVNDTILLPGQIFSYNAALGERTEEKGYGPANAYLNGELVQEVGGGICQLSSALYWCVLLADQEVLERTNHAYYQTYLPYGFDATVSWGGPDFAFRLRGDYPIRIYARIENKQLHVELWGTKLEEGRVELEYEVNAVVPHDTLYLENKNVRSGTQVILDYGRDGMTVTTYRLYYDGEGKLLERVEEAVNEYAERDAEIIVAVGELPKK